MSEVKPETSTILKTSGILILISLIVNILIFVIANTFDVFDGVEVPSPDGSTSTLTVVQVIVSTLAFLIVASVVFVILFRRMNIALQTIRIIAIIVVVLSLSLPFTIPDIPTGALISLELMHIITGVIVIPGLTTDVLYRRM